MIDNIQLLYLPNSIDNTQSPQYVKSFVNIPPICPVCGSTDIFRSLKIKPRYFVFPEKREYLVSHNSLNINFCTNHSNNIVKTAFIFLLSLFLMSFLPFIIFIFIIINFTLRMVLLALIASAISVGIGLTGFLYEHRKETNKNLMIRKHFFFEYYQSIGVIISINCSNWFNKFKELNKYYEVSNIDFEKLTNLENSGLKFRKNMNSSLKLFLIATIVGLVSLIPFFVKIIPNHIILTVSLSLAMFFIGIYLYEAHLNESMQKQRSTIFQQFKDINQL